jgi:hypothetical protein
VGRGKNSPGGLSLSGGGLSAGEAQSRLSGTLGFEGSRDIAQRALRSRGEVSESNVAVLIAVALTDGGTMQRQISVERAGARRK